MDRAGVTSSSEDFEVVTRVEVAARWAKLITHLRRICFRQHLWAFLGLHLRDNVSKAIRDRLKAFHY
jgi:hypothetical protein